MLPDRGSSAAWLGSSCVLADAVRRRGRQSEEHVQHASGVDQVRRAVPARQRARSPLTCASRSTRYANQAVITAKTASQALSGRVCRVRTDARSGTGGAGAGGRRTEDALASAGFFPVC